MMRYLLLAATLAGCWLVPVGIANAQSRTRGGYIPYSPPRYAPSRLPVTLIVRLPAEAKLFIENSTTRQEGAERRFQSPALPLGRRYSYTLKATWNENGKEVVQQRVVPVQGGQEVVVDFRKPQAPSK